MTKHERGAGCRPIRLTTKMCNWVLTVAYRCARRAGMTAEESEDFAADTQARLLDLDEAVRLPPQHLMQAWLYRCVDNYAKNAARAVRRLRLREETLGYLEAGDDFRSEFADRHEQPEVEAVRAELQARIRIAVLGLSPWDRNLFRARCICGRPVGELAVELNRSPSAVREASRTMRRRLQALLARQGMTHAEVAEYLRIIEQGPAPAKRCQRRTQG